MPTIIAESLAEQINSWIEQRIQAMATEEIEQARNRLKLRIPELAAEIGVKIATMVTRA